MKKELILGLLTITITLNANIATHTASRQIGLAVEKNDLKGIQQALVNGGNINFKNNARYQQTPLMCACEYMHKEAAQELIAKGADINKQDEDGRTALTYTALAPDHTKSAEITTLLMQKGANSNIADRQQKTPLIYAFEVGNLPVAFELLQAKISNKKAIEKVKAAFERAKEKAQKNYYTLYKKIENILTDL